MPVAEITCQFVNPPKPGKRNGSIKSAEGDYYWGSQATIAEFRQGEVVKIEYTTKPKDGGGEWRTIVKKIGGAPPVSPNIPQVRARSNPSDSEQIFTTALLKEFIAAGKIELSTAEIIAAVNALRSAYRNTFGGTEKQKNDTDMQDEVPDF